MSQATCAAWCMERTTETNTSPFVVYNCYCPFRLLDDISGKPLPSESAATPTSLEMSDLKGGFYTSKETPRHFLDNDDISCKWVKVH